MTKSLEGQVALVTGAGRGFGRAIAGRLAAEGAAVALVSRSREQLEAVAGEIEAAGGRALVAVGDVTSRADVERIGREVRATMGPVTTLVSNAGVPGPFGPIWQVDPDRWWAAQQVHIRAPQLLVHEFTPEMVAAGRGCVIFISARAARIVAPHMSAYTTGKIAQNRIVAQLAAEAGAHGVSAFALDPGFVYTQLAEDTRTDPDAQRWMPGMMGRLDEKKTEAGEDLERCARRCADLATGRYAPLSGGYYELGDDLDAALAKLES